MTREDLRTANLKKPVDVAEYLFTRLYQLGIRSIHGVPGDFNLVALDYIPKVGLKWVGNCNELNAAYAADGYARVNGMGAIVTTFGVGELSALNGLAGAYSEMVPVVHIVGCPSTASQRSGMLLHHTLGNGDFHVFAGMSAGVSCAVAKLNDAAEIAGQVDHALRECRLHTRPVYVMLPTDMATKKVEGERLDTPIDLAEPANDPAREDYVVDVVLRSLHAARRPVVLVDACAVRSRVLDEVHALVDVTRLPVFVTPMGKSAIDETHPCYGGVYAGSASRPAIKAAVEGADLVLSVGALKSDFNTAGFSYRLSQLSTVDLHTDHCAVRYSEYPGVRMRGVLRKLAARVDVERLSVLPPPPHPGLASDDDDNNDNDDELGSEEREDRSGRPVDGPIKQAWFWPRISHFFREGDIVVSETGTANFGIWETRFPPRVTALNQTLWGSIGWAVGACQGAALAAQDAATATAPPRRTILFEGDGSIQLTAQEIGTMIKHGLDIIIFIICNDGYTIERFIHGMDAAYNDVPTWRYGDLGVVFGGTAATVRSYAARTPAELESLLADDDFAVARRGLRLVELYMGREDAPRSLKMTAEVSARTNARETA
ncbi:putative pyruvate decarboxylase [Rosellinia necatrix]|uniref:Pyruvate decarboxylase n=1 Tax=Rosellinia necatrix TaxID=77044 RepID=A0A1W2TNB3_ROSNE|nr:putative pyruvate decarboxylase [Rosellinia necatrix]